MSTVTSDESRPAANQLVELSLHFNKYESRHGFIRFIGELTLRDDLKELLAAYAHLIDGDWKLCISSHNEATVRLVVQEIDRWEFERIIRDFFTAERWQFCSRHSKPFTAPDTVPVVV